MPMFFHTHRVTYADCTIGNHVYYGRYLELLESARGEFFRSLGNSFLKWQLQGAAFPVIECRLRYKMPAQYDELINIAVAVSSVGGARVGFEYVLTKNSGELVLEAETMHACTELNGKPRRLPPELATLLRAASDPSRPLSPEPGLNS